MEQTENQSQKMKMTISYWIFLAFIICVTIIIYKLSHVLVHAYSYLKLPGPYLIEGFGKGYMFVTSEKLFSELQRWSEMYQPIYRIFSGFTTPSIVIYQPEHVELLLKSNTNINKGLVLDFMKPWLGNGTFLSSGARWTRLRKAAMTSINNQLTDNFIDICNDNAKMFIERLNKKTGEVLDISPIISVCTLNIVCDSTFEKRISSTVVGEDEYAAAVDRLLYLIFERTFCYITGSKLLFGLTATGKEYNKHLKVVKTFSTSVIKEKKKRRMQEKILGNVDETGRKRKKSYIDDLFDLIDNNQLQISDKDIICEVNNLIFAGHDTMLANINWTVFLLGNNPEIQEEAYKEQMQIFSDNERLITMNDLSEMKLLERIIKEALRLYPSAPIIVRKLEEDVMLGDYMAPKGIEVLINIFKLHRNPQIYPNPNVFDPGRFEGDKIKERGIYTYVPFSAGPRNCVGQKLAMVEAKVILSYLLRSYQIESVEKPQDIEYRYQFILTSNSGIKVKLRPRKNRITDLY